VSSNPKNIGSLLQVLESKQIISIASTKNIQEGSLVVFNSESVFFYFRDYSYRTYVRTCKYIVIDGFWLGKILNIFNFNLTLCTGSDLMSELIKSTESRKVLIGGSKTNHLLVESGMVHSFIDLPYDSNIDKLALLAFESLQTQIPISQKLILFISLGLPKQEIFSLKLASLMNNERFLYNKKTLIVPIGAAADFLSGAKQRAPLILRKLGLETLHRVLMEIRIIPRAYRACLGLWFLISKRNEVH